MGAKSNTRKHGSELRTADGGRPRFDDDVNNVNKPQIILSRLPGPAVTARLSPESRGFESLSTQRIALAVAAVTQLRQRAAATFKVTGAQVV
jgi:hypothetical protein